MEMVVEKQAKGKGVAVDCGLPAENPTTRTPPLSSPPFASLDDCKKLIGRIADAEDRHLIDESVCAFEAGAFRAAYIMTWIAAAESLRRRIVVVAQRDSVAGKILGEIEDGERKHFAVDGKIIDGAFRLGLIGDIEKTRLAHIFESRNIFGHPYNTAPSGEDVLAAIRYVVETVLLRAIKLRHSYVDERLKCLLCDATYLDDDADKVSRYAQEVAKRVDDGVHEYLFKKYVEGIDAIWCDPEKRVLRRRGLQFCKVYLMSIGGRSAPLSAQWLDLMSEYPEILSWLAGWKEIFLLLDVPSQDSAVLKNIEYAQGGSSHGRLKRLKEMERIGVLSESQARHLNDALSKLSGYQLHQTAITISELYPFAKAKLDSYDYATANSGADFFFSFRSGDLEELSEENQRALGMSLCDAAIMNAHSALGVVSGLVSGDSKVPECVRIGYCSRFFSEGVVSALQKEQLWKKSIDLLFSLSLNDRVQIENSFSVATRHEPLCNELASDSGQKFVQAYELAKQRDKARGQDS